jgi:hypothetical protein
MEKAFLVGINRGKKELSLDSLEELGMLSKNCRGGKYWAGFKKC